MKPLLALLLAALALGALYYQAEERARPAESGGMWETSLDAWQLGDCVSTTTGKVLPAGTCEATGKAVEQEQSGLGRVPMPPTGAFEAAEKTAELERLRETIRGVYGWHEDKDWKGVCP